MNQSSRTWSLPIHKLRLRLSLALPAFVLCSLLLSGCQLPNTGGSSRPNVNAPSLQANWVLKGGLSSWFQREPTVAAADGKVYVIASSDNESSKEESEDNVYLWSLKADTGEETWKFEFPGHKGTVPSVADGKVYFGTSIMGTGTYYLYCVDAENGTLSWKVPLGDYHNDSSTPIISDGIVYLGTQPSITDEDAPYFVYAIEANSGKVIWKHELAGGVSSIALTDGVLYLGNQYGPMTGEATKLTYLHALDIKTGDELWAFETQAQVYAPPVVVGNTVYFVSGSSRGPVLRALDKVSGQEEWQFEQENSTLSAPIISGTNLYLGVNEVRERCIDNCGPARNYTDYLYTLDPATGAEKAKVKVELPIAVMPIMADGVLYSLDFGGLLYGTEARTGQIKWKFDLGDTASTLPVVYEGVMYVASWAPGNLFAVMLPSSTPVPDATPTASQPPVQPQPNWGLNVRNEQYDQALRKWHSYGVEDYELAVSISDYYHTTVPEHLVGEYVMHVSGQRVKLLKRMPTYSPKTHSEGYDGRIETATAMTDWDSFLSGYTVEGQFKRVLSLLKSSKPAYCRVDFDPSYGYPRNIVCKNDPADVYEAMQVGIYSFRPLKLRSTPILDPLPDGQP